MAGAHSSSLNSLLLGLCLVLGAAHLCLHVYGSVETGFSVKLIHRDSPESPFYDPASTPSSRLHDSIRRSASYADYLYRTQSHNSNSPLHTPDIDSLYAQLTNYNFQFMIIAYLGSKRFKFYAIVGTSHGLLSLLCYDCHDCYEHTHDIFDPKSSTSYETLNCNSHECSLLSTKSCGKNDWCKFTDDHSGGSYSKGYLSRETLGLVSTASNRIVDLNNITFGCIHKTKGKFSKYGIGIIGLDRGLLSLVNQFSPSYKRMFSYCLPSENLRTSHVSFGSAARVSGLEAVTTPLVHGIRNNSYYLILKSIKVAKSKAIKIPQNAVVGDGNIIIDSSTLYTYIPNSVLTEVIRLVKNNTNGVPIINMTSSTLSSHFELCFDISKAKRSYRMPKITFKFAGGADVSLRKNNVYTPIDEKTLCFGILSNDHLGGLSVYGTLAQMDHRIEYNLVDETLTLIQQECI